MIYYLPGCDFAKNHPEASRIMTEYLLKKGMKIAQCCQNETDYFSEGDTLITNCTQCSIIMKERIPYVRQLSLYEYLLTDEEFIWPDYASETMTVQDCRRTAEYKEMQEAVRECLRRMNISFIETEENKENSTFCGVWLNNPANPVCVKAAPETFRKLEQYREILSPEEQKKKMIEHVRSYSTEKVIVYCNGCEKGLKLGGGHPVHLMELLAGRSS